MPDPQVLLIPAADMRERITRLRRQLISTYLMPERPYPIDEAMVAGGIEPNTEAAARLLRGRGEITFTSGRMHNAGLAFDAPFTVYLSNQQVRIDVRFLASIDGAVQFDDDQLSLQLDTPIPVTLRDSLGTVPKRLELIRLSASDGLLIYELRKRGNSGNELHIILDLLASSPHPASVSPHVLLAMALISDGPCPGETWVIRRAQMSGLCYVQMKTASPLGEALPGEYESRSDAENAKQELIKKGTCAPE